ncbi:Hypothetical predicted protein, partial [Paramuricea clavata]
EHLLVSGDFNIHSDVSDDADTVKFHDLLESLGLEQHVTKSTHIHGHILDLVITRKTENIIPFPPRSCSYFSDHISVHFDIAIKNHHYRLNQSAIERSRLSTLTASSMNWQAVFYAIMNQESTLSLKILIGL